MTFTRPLVLITVIIGIVVFQEVMQTNAIECYQDGRPYQCDHQVQGYFDACLNKGKWSNGKFVDDSRCVTNSWCQRDPDEQKNEPVLPVTPNCSSQTDGPGDKMCCCNATLCNDKIKFDGSIKCFKGNNKDGKRKGMLYCRDYCYLKKGPGDDYVQECKGKNECAGQVFKKCQKVHVDDGEAEECCCSDDWCNNRDGDKIPTESNGNMKKHPLIFVTIATSILLIYIFGV